MGAVTRMKLAEFAERTGIEPATGRRGELLEALSKQAFKLIKIIELERSGIRDGDGYWHGSDALGATFDDLSNSWQQLQRIERGEACDAALDEIFPREPEF